MPVGDDLDFQTRYRVLRSTSSNSRFRTHAALEQRTGRAVMVHMVDAADPETIDRIREQVRQLPPAEARHVLELATIPSGFVVVTEFLQGLTFFSEWLDERSAAGALSETDQRRAPEESKAEKPAPDFAPTVIIASPVAAAPVAAPVAAAPPAPPSPVAEPPVVQTNAADDSPSSSAPTVVRSAVKTSVAPAPSPSAPTPVSPPAATIPDKPEPGEFTRIFKMAGSPVTSPTTADHPSPPTHVSPPTPTHASDASHAAPFLAEPASEPTPAPSAAAQIPDAKPGEYTQIFGAKSAPQPNRGPQPSSLSPLGDVGSKLPTPPVSERASGGGATGTFGVWGAPPAPASDFGFGRSDAHAASKLPPSSFPPISPSPLSPSVPAKPSIPAPPSIPAASSIPGSPFGAGALPAAGLSPLLQGPPANLPTPPTPSPLSGRVDDSAKRDTPAVPPLPAIQTPAFGVGLPPLQGLGDPLDSPFVKPSAPKSAGGYTQINKSVTPAPPPAVAPPAKVVANKREGFRPPTALVIVIAVVVILAITLILYFALRAPVRPPVAPATNGAASSAVPSAPQATPTTTPVTTPPTTSPKNP